MIPNSIVQLLFLVFGTLRPGYQTYLQFKNGGVKGCNEWVKYWIVYSVLTAFWSITDMLFFWLPLYEEVKLAFMIWLLIATPSGSAILFDQIICPLMVRNEKTLQILMKEGKEQMYEDLRKAVPEVYAWMGRCILPSITNTIRIQLYPVLISAVRSFYFKFEKNIAGNILETEIEEHSVDECGDALNTQVPEEKSEEATQNENKPCFDDSEPINQNRNIDNDQNNLMPITGKFDICELIQLVQYKEEIKDVKDEAISKKIGQSTSC